MLPILAIASSAQSTTVGEFRPPPAPEQPVAFSHRIHVAQGLACTHCHAGAASAAAASLPPLATCMGCHATVRTDSAEVQKLAGYASRKEDVPWRRVYRVPTYVYFSHAVHAADTSITCDTCHGAVRELDVMQKLRDTSMAACMQCHTEKSAPVRCDACHEPR
jgi:hypothetical protein